MADAIDRFVPDGAAVAIGTSLEPLIPFAAGHELIRQGRKDLELIGPISDSLFDELIGAGCARCITAAWVGNVSEGLGHCYRRAAEQGIPRRIEIHDHTNFSISLALWAAAWNVPYLPARTLLGSDIINTNPRMKVVDCLTQIEAVRPDVTILHVQRCDERGRAHAWGPLGISEEAGLAADRVIIGCEELVDESVTLSDPNRILLPETKVVAVVHEPGGAHPAPVQGFWKRDHALDNAYADESRTREGYEAWLKRWVLDVPDRKTYMSMVDVESIRIRGEQPSASVNYADE